MDYFKATWYPRIGMWISALQNLPLASQETCAAMEFYHNQLKLRLLNEKKPSVYKRVDWLVDKLGTKVHSYFWLDEYSEKDDFARYWKDEWVSGLTSWRKALKIPDSNVVMEGTCAKVINQLDQDRAYLVWNPGSQFGICNCSWANTVLWNTMISGFARHACSLEVMILFEKMQQMGTFPSEVTYVSVLTASCHMGLVESGRKYFNLMITEHNVSPNVVHYSCMVDLFGRSGLLLEAYNLIEEMPFDATASMWGSLLASCRIHGKLHLAEVAAKHLSEIELNNAVNHILLSNIYAANKKWDEVARIRKLLKESEFKKERGKSWIEIKDKVHSFMVGERKHARIAEIYSKLDCLIEELKIMGYKTETEHDLHYVGENRKHELLRHHSEKLALTLGLMCLPSNASIRIMKNLRICGDCHSFMKIASSFTGREIIVRDTNRFHHFKNGCCSCREFW
ncbi:hypothetical protein GBA52_008429 [Prunus armeniaca]|nr:hypothetical protein GBA52_008429 [Prunus armeniaca]